MNCNTTHYRANSSSVPGDPTAHCRKRAVPTVFWNKEDAPNYATFIHVAKAFDRVFTTDANCIPQYHRDLGHDRVQALPFAAQPRIHNPIGSFADERFGLCFAGTWYQKKHDVRRQNMEVVLEPALNFPLHIFDRQYGKSQDPALTFPAEYQPHIMGGLNYSSMLSAYRRYAAFLNVNSVNDSPTMLSRRVFEILACGTPVISSPARAIDELLGEHVIQCSDAAASRAAIERVLGDREWRDRHGHAAYRFVMQRHTYAQRFDEILKSLGLFDGGRSETNVWVMAEVENATELAQVRESFHRQTHAAKRLLVRWREGSAEADVFTASEFAKALATVPKDVALAVMSPRAAYGSQYLTDQLLPRLYTDARVITKGAHYRNGAAGSPELQHADRQHQFVTAVVPEATVLVGEGLDSPEGLAKWQENLAGARPLTQGVADWVQTLTGEQTIYSADRFNFVFGGDVKTVEI